MADGEDVREPVAQVEETVDGARLIVELPGVTQDSIKMGVSSDILKVDAEGKRGKFSTVQVISFEPDPERISVTFSQGVLEVDMKRKDSKETKIEKTEEEELSISLDSLEKELERFKEQLGKVSEEKSLLEERVHFLQKDFQNIRRRHETEKESIADRKIIEIGSGLIDVLDSFIFAKESINRSSSAKDNIVAMMRGIEMVENQVLNLFNRIGIKIMASEGRPFDPNFHEAIGYTESMDLEDEVISKEIKECYLYKGNALRPAQVIVNRRPKGPAKKKLRSSKKNNDTKE